MRLNFLKNIFLSQEAHILLKYLKGCAENHFRDPETNDCVPCGCDLEGSTSQACDAFGNCQCQIGVIGQKCDRCQDNHWGLSRTGCQPCHCNIDGSFVSIKLFYINLLLKKTRFKYFWWTLIEPFIKPGLFIRAIKWIMRRLRMSNIYLSQQVFGFPLIIAGINWLVGCIAIWPWRSPEDTVAKLIKFLIFWYLRQKTEN